MNTSYLDPISEVISISNTPMVLFVFASGLNIVATNAKGRELLSSCRSVYPVIKKTYLDMKLITKKICFNKRIFLLNSCPIFEQGNVTGVLVTTSGIKLKEAERK